MAKVQLRSNFEYGTSRWAVRRAQWRALGLTNEDMLKPKIAVVNTSSELSSCFSHLDEVSRVVKQAILAAGGYPFEIRTAAPSDFITSAGKRGGYILPTRDLITNDIEVAVEGAQLDGMVFLGSCDKTSPGQLMAAARLNLPSIMVICGYQKSGSWRGQHMDIEDVFLHAGHVAAGKVTPAELEEMSDNAVLGPGVCAGMGTANSMHIVCEALGMTLPGSAPVAAMSERMFANARESGQRIVEMIQEDLRPRTILTPAAFANACACVLAVSGSINCIKHMQAIACEAESSTDVYATFEALSARVPVLAAVRPNGEDLIEDFDAAGGAQALLQQLRPFLLDAPTVSGTSMLAQLTPAAVRNAEVIRPLARPFSTQPAIVIIKGNLAAEGAIVKMGLTHDKVTRFRGPARIYHSREDALAGLARHDIQRGDVVVMRCMGVRGGPGMSMASALVFALDGADMGADVAVVTDGQLSGLVNRGLVVGEVTPETLAGGPLWAARDGDTIAIDVPARSITLEVDPAEIARRLAEKPAPKAGAATGWLSIYQRTVQPLARGASLIPLQQEQT